MTERQKLFCNIQNISTQDFDKLALRVFHYQARCNPVYQKFLQILQIPILDVQSIQEVPFLPVEIFKHHQVQTGTWMAQRVFTSSGTSKQQVSQHYVRDLSFYARHSIQTFEQVYGNLQDYVVLALLPSYLERTGSSLVYMVQQFINRSEQPESGFFLYNTGELSELLKKLLKKGKPVLLLGVTYALLDFARDFAQPLHDVVIMETGGMKGRRKEMIRSAVHEVLKDAFQVPFIHSEYGMTELLSQAYALRDGRFRPASSMQILVRDSSDPFALLDVGQAGSLSVIDLANLDSCSFITTDDLGRVHADGSFEVLGRLDASDLRGCNLLIAD